MSHINHSEEFEPEYFCYAAKRWETYLKGQTSGSGIPHVDKGVLAKLEILKLPTDEQKLVAYILNQLQYTIEQTEALITKQQRIKTGLMQDLLTKGIDEHGNIRSEATHDFKDSPLGRIPVDWDLKFLGSIVHIIDCKHYTPKYVNEGIPIIRPRNIKDSGFDLSNLDFVSENDYQLLTDKHQPRDGDIVFSRNGSFGVPVYVNGVGRFCIGQDVVIMKWKSVNTQFLYYELKSANIVQQITNLSGGSTFGRIDLSAIRNLLVIFPINEIEQVEISKRLSLCDRKINTLCQDHAKLCLIKSGLMRDLLTGKRRVTNLLAETALQD
jgi:type I restriction enzyme S subunit